LSEPRARINSEAAIRCIVLVLFDSVSSRTYGQGSNGPVTIRLFPIIMEALKNC